MRNLNRLNPYRVRSDRGIGDETCGAFQIKIKSVTLNVIASANYGWDHVSISVLGEERTPTWTEMDAIKRKFFEDTETAMQLHPPIEDHISIHPYTLHLWRPHDVAIPMPPKQFV